MCSAVSTRSRRYVCLLAAVVAEGVDRFVLFVILHSCPNVTRSSRARPASPLARRPAGASTSSGVRLAAFVVGVMLALRVLA
jgi:hypothetical protein